MTLPASVNLTALPARLISTWRRWCGSPRTAGGTSGMIETTNSTPFAAACAETMRQVLLTSACRSKSIFSSTTLPASILEKSSTSSTRPSITREEPRSVCSMSACSRLSGVSRSRSDMPMMALSGVRSSWLTIEMKRRLAWLAASARASASNMRRTSDSTYRLTANMPTSRPTPSAVCARHQSFTYIAMPKPATLMRELGHQVARAEAEAAPQRHPDVEQEQRRAPASPKNVMYQLMAATSANCANTRRAGEMLVE